MKNLILNKETDFKENQILNTNYNLSNQNIFQCLPNSNNVDSNQRFNTNQILQNLNKNSENSKTINFYLKSEDLDEKVSNKNFIIEKNLNSNHIDKINKDQFNDKMYLNRNLIYESSSDMNYKLNSLISGRTLVNDNQMNIQQVGNQQINNQVINSHQTINNHQSISNHQSINNHQSLNQPIQSINGFQSINGHSQLNDHQNFNLNQQELNKQNNIFNQIITGNAYSNHPFNDTLMQENYVPEMNSTYYQSFNLMTNKAKDGNTNSMQTSKNFDFINDQNFQHQNNFQAKACPIAQNFTNNSNLLTGHSLDALNTVGLSTASKDNFMFKKPFSTISNKDTINFNRQLLINSFGQAESSGHLNSINSNGLINNTLNSSEVDIRRFCLSEQQKLEFNLIQDLEQKNKLNQQNQLNQVNEIVHSTPKTNTLKKNKKILNQSNKTDNIRSPTESKVKNICSKLFGSSNYLKSSNSKQANLKINNLETENELDKNLNSKDVLDNVVNYQPKSSKLLASAVTNLQHNNSNNINLNQKTVDFNQLDSLRKTYNERLESSLNDDSSKKNEKEENVIYAEIRKKQLNTDGTSLNVKVEKTNQNENNELTYNMENPNFIDDKYVVVVDSSFVSTNSDQNKSSQSLTVKDSNEKDLSNKPQNLMIKETENNLNEIESYEKCLKNINSSESQIKSQKKSNEKLGLESPTTSSSESGRGTLNGEQQVLNSNPVTNNHSRQENNEKFDQTSVTSEDMKRFKEEVIENWNSNNNKKLNSTNSIDLSNSIGNSLNSNASNKKNKLESSEKNLDELKAFEQVQLKIQKLLDGDALTNDEDFDDLLASDAYQNYTARAMNLNCINKKLDRLSVVNESDGSWLSDSTQNSMGIKSSNQNMAFAKKITNQQLNQQSNFNYQNKTDQKMNSPLTHFKTKNLFNTNSDTIIESPNHQKESYQTSNYKQQSSCNNQVNSQSINTQDLATKQELLQKQKHQNNPHHFHVDQSPKMQSKHKQIKVNKPSKIASSKNDSLTALISENSKRLNKLNKNPYKNKSMDDLTDLMDDLNSVYTEATMNYNAPTVVKKQLKGIENMYSEILTLLNSRMNSVKNEIKPLKRNKFGGSESSLNTDISKCYAKPLKSSYLRRSTLEDMNSRKMKRLENHVITLSKSVAQLTSELRANQNYSLEIQYLRKEVEQLKNRVHFNLMISDDLNNNKLQQNSTSAGETLPRKSNTLNNQQINLSSSNNVATNSGKNSLMSGWKKFFSDDQLQIRQFLKKLGYEKYASKFEAEKIGLNELVYLNEEKLQKLGLPMGPRIRVLQEIQNFISSTDLNY